MLVLPLPGNVPPPPPQVATHASHGEHHQKAWPRLKHWSPQGDGSFEARGTLGYHRTTGLTEEERITLIEPISYSSTTPIRRPFGVASIYSASLPTDATRVLHAECNTVRHANILRVQPGHRYMKPRGWNVRPRDRTLRRNNLRIPGGGAPKPPAPVAKECNGRRGETYVDDAFSSRPG